MAVYVGVNRRQAAMHASSPEPHGTPPSVWDADVEGAAAELAVARALNRYWCGLDGSDRLVGDVDGCQVRHSRRPDASLILHSRDLDDQRFILVVGSMPVLRLAGWAFGHEGKVEGFFRRDVPRPAFFVPQSALRRMEARGEGV